MHPEIRDCPVRPDVGREGVGLLPVDRGRCHDRAGDREQRAGTGRAADPAGRAGASFDEVVEHARSLGGAGSERLLQPQP